MRFQLVDDFHGKMLLDEMSGFCDVIYMAWCEVAGSNAKTLAVVKV